MNIIPINIWIIKITQSYKVSITQFFEIFVMFYINIHKCPNAQSLVNRHFELQTIVDMYDPDLIGITDMVELLNF